MDIQTPRSIYESVPIDDGIDAQLPVPLTAHQMMEQAFGQAFPAPKPPSPSMSPPPRLKRSRPQATPSMKASEYEGGQQSNRHRHEHQGEYRLQRKSGHDDMQGFQPMEREYGRHSASSSSFNMAGNSYEGVGHNKRRSTSPRREQSSSGKVAKILATAVSALAALEEEE